MILRAVEFQTNASKSPDDTADVVIKLWFDLRCDEWTSILRRKNNVVEEVGVRVRHVDRTLLDIVSKSAPPNLCRPLRGLCKCSCMADPGVPLRSTPAKDAAISSRVVDLKNLGPLLK